MANIKRTDELSQNPSPPMGILAVRVPVGVKVEAEVGYWGRPCFLSTMALDEGMTS